MVYRHAINAWLIFIFIHFVIPLPAVFEYYKLRNTQTRVYRSERVHHWLMVYLVTIWAFRYLRVLSVCRLNKHQPSASSWLMQADTVAQRKLCPTTFRLTHKLIQCVQHTTFNIGVAHELSIVRLACSCNRTLNCTIYFLCDCLYGCVSYPSGNAIRFTPKNPPKSISTNNVSYINWNHTGS